MNDWRDQEVPESLGRTRAVGLPQQCRRAPPGCLVLLAIDQELAKARLSG
jgi:hypothetical protein